MSRFIIKGVFTLAGATLLIMPAIVFQASFSRPAQAEMCIKPTGEVGDCGGGDGIIGGGVSGNGTPVHIRDPRWDPPGGGGNGIGDDPEPCQQGPHPNCVNDGDDAPSNHPPHPRPIKISPNQRIDPSTLNSIVGP
jgi:hypothetical protein